MSYRGKKYLSRKGSPDDTKGVRKCMGKAVFVKVKLNKPLQLVENLNRVGYLHEACRWTAGSLSTCTSYPENIWTPKAFRAPDDFIEPVNELNIPSIHEYEFHSKHPNPAQLVGVIDKPHLQKTFTFGRKSLKGRK